MHIFKVPQSPFENRVRHPRAPSTSSEGISNQAVVLHQVEAFDLVHVRIQRGDRGQESGPQPLLKNRMCKGFLPGGGGGGGYSEIFIHT